jgi:hypothetical protein
MKIIRFKITGNGALLMHNPASMRGNRGAQRGATSIPEPYDEAKAGLYVNGEHQLYLKSDAFREAALTAAKSFKASRGKGTLVNTFAAAVFLCREHCLLFRPNTDVPITDADTDWEIDIRRAVVQRNGILRSRPKISNWQCALELETDDEIIKDPGLIAQVLNESGKFPGVGDYRVGKKGPFGRYTAELANA